MGDWQRVSSPLALPTDKSQVKGYRLQVADGSHRG